MSQDVYLLTILLPLVTILIVFCMKYCSAAYQARARIATDAAYRALAEKAAAAQSDTAAALSFIQAELAQIATGLASVTRILKEVE